MQDPDVQFTLGVALFFAVIALFFAPSIIGLLRHHHQLALIVFVNLFLGLSVIGWFAALVMALTPTIRTPRVVYVPTPAWPPPAEPGRRRPAGGPGPWPR